MRQRNVVFIVIALVIVTVASGDFCSFTDISGFDPRDVLVSATEPSDPRAFTIIANGYVGTVVGNDSVFISGVYNGEATTGL